MAVDSCARQGVIVGGLSPHPPIIVPAVGGNELAKARPTVEGVRRLAERMVAADPATIVVVGPHGPVLRSSFAALGHATVAGDLGEFGAPQVRVAVRTDTELLQAIAAAAAGAGLSVTTLAGGRGGGQGAGEARASVGKMDYATLVPLYYLGQAGFSGRVLIIGMAYADLQTCFAFGRLIHQAATTAAIPVGVLASGDLSHRLQPGAPAGYDPRGAAFDRAVMGALAANDPAKLLGLDPELIEAAGECGLRPAAIMFGAVSAAGLRPTVLSYEGPFGVGYGVALFEAADEHQGPSSGGEHPLVALARRTIEAYVREGRTIAPPPGPVAEDLPQSAGVFVSLHRRGELRGCIGTIGPTRDSLNEEIIHNAIAAATEDPRFAALNPAELSDLAISVDVLGQPEPVTDRSQLDPKRYGVIVERGPRRGLLLPDLEGVDDVAHQVSIAAQKAGLSPRDPNLRLYRFTVTRYH